MKPNRKSQLLFKSVVFLSFLSFIYLNFIVQGDPVDFSISSIAEYEQVESSALKEFKMISSALTKIMEIITLNR